MPKRGPFPTKHDGYAMAASFLFDAAVEACIRCGNDGRFPAQTIKSHDPYTAVVFAAASYEGFLNDCFVSLQHLAQLGLGSSLVRLLGELGVYMIDKEENARIKTDIAHVLFTGTKSDWSGSPSQDWILLAGLRNMLLHMRPEGFLRSSDEGSLTPVYPKLIEGLKCKGILDTKQQWASWHPLVQTPAVARWAVGVAYKMTNGFNNAAPKEIQDSIQMLLQSFTRPYEAAFGSDEAERPRVIGDSP